MGGALDTRTQKQRKNFLQEKKDQLSSTRGEIPEDIMMMVKLGVIITDKISLVLIKIKINRCNIEIINKRDMKMRKDVLKEEGEMIMIEDSKEDHIQCVQEVI